jgi:hypothetical protein
MNKNLLIQNGIVLRNDIECKAKYDTYHQNNYQKP